MDQAVTFSVILFSIGLGKAVTAFLIYGLDFFLKKGMMPQGNQGIIHIGESGFTKIE